MASPKTLWQVASAAQIVVVQRGQIVMDQRIGVQHFQRRPEFFDSRGKRSRDHASGFHAKDRTQSFASGKNAVPHRFVNRDRRLGFRGSSRSSAASVSAWPC